MSKIMLIDAAHAEETRVAVVNDRRVEDFDFESRDRKQLRGNIYLAKVTRVEPSLQAAFIEYGGNRHGFLAFNEIHPDYYQIPVADREAIMAEAETEEEKAEAEAEADNDEGLSADEAKLRRRLMRRYKIQEVIRRRQILLVQVVKEERGAKGAALTTRISLAGRYCVLMPNTGKGGGISRKITSATDRKRLKAAAQSLEVPQGMGLIIRTAGAKRTKAEIKRDYEYLLRLWEDIRETTLKSHAPSLIYQEEDLVRRAVRDMFDKDFESLQVEGEDAWREARDFMRVLSPSLAKKVQRYEGSTPLFVKHKVEDVLTQLQTPTVPLKSGGYLVINQTEALVAIDVNSGKATKERNIETTALKTNLEAAEEAARQMRLRDLAGLIVIDFIDMEETKNNRAVEKALASALESDRARLQMGKISQFGLMEISRQRRRMGLLEGVTHTCEHCGGSGRVRSTESSALLAMRAAEAEAGKGEGAIVLRAPAAVALYILNHKRDALARLHAVSGLFVTIEIDEHLANGESAIERIDMEVPPPPVVAAVTRERVTYGPEDEADEAVPDDEPDDDDLDDEDLEDADDDQSRAALEEVEDGRDGGRGGRRRRRRRGGRRGEAGSVAGEADETVSVGTDDEDDDAGSRRRRRGRRGGRRGRDGDGGRDGVYGWVRGRTPSLDDPYVWFDPLERAPRTAPAAETSDATPVPAPVLADPEPTDTAPSREPRRRRVRRKTVAAVTAVTDLDEANAPIEVVEAPVPAVEAEAETQAAAPAPEAPTEDIVVLEAPADEDNASSSEGGAENLASELPLPEGEITAPPEKPKRGWWRLGR
ncbi:MAG: Rne/Rng family ribonuclease [Caulobacterales bacterium]|nr:Rne/Rng family ribonuclease [Caulobacterales bacterium]